MGKWPQVRETPVVIGFARCPLLKKKWALPTLKVGNLLTNCEHAKKAHFKSGQWPLFTTKSGQKLALNIINIKNDFCHNFCDNMTSPIPSN